MPLHVSFACVAFVLHRPAHILILLAVFRLVLLTGNLSPRLPPGDATVLACVVGSFAFFALGNSHSVATIDISGGNALSYSYNRDVVAALSTVVVYTGPIWATLSAVGGGRAFRDHSKQLMRVWMWQSVRLAVMSAVVVAMQSHLFIWSVFAPRWAYEVLGTAVQLGACFVSSL